MDEDLIFAGNFDALMSESLYRHCTHALCQAGEVSFNMAGESFRMREGDCIILTHNELVSDIKQTDDFKATVLYIANSFAHENLPRNDYDVIGKLTLLRNPVMALAADERETFLDDVRQLEKRLESGTHRFQYELIGCLTEVFILDLYDFHARIYERPAVSEQSALLLDRFIELLRTGEYQTHREVAYYASRLCITPKYLTEICKKVSGYHANFWIDRFTITEITRLLSNKNLTLKEISDRMNFSSISYFSRYVHRMLKVTPSEYRNNIRQEA